MLASSRRKYLLRMRHLLATDAFPVASCTVRERANIVFVEKSGKDTIRLFLDARRGNRLIASPPGDELCSSEALARLEVQGPEATWGSGLAA